MRLPYSGGPDTSVTLTWIHGRYDAEAIALCIDPGQPADDVDEVRRKALDPGAVESLVVDTQEESDHSLATCNADASLSQQASPGSIELFSLQSRMTQRISEARRRG